MILILIFYSATIINSEAKKYWYAGEYHEDLCKRRKGNHLMPEHKKYICQLFRDFPNEHQNIRIAYKLSPAIFNKLNKISNSKDYPNNLNFQMNSYQLPISEEAQNIITKAVKPPARPLTIRKICEIVYKESGERYSAHILRRFVKKGLRYSFKKAWSRPPKYSNKETKIAKGLFWTEILRMIHSEQSIFNVDEWSFTRAVKMEYSWLPMGHTSSIINDFWKGRANLILSVGSNAQWFGVIKTGTVDSKTFCIFIKLLEKVLLETESVGQWIPVVIMDNARIHSSIYTRSVMNNSKLKVKFLPPYCPEVAPVEHVFRAIKSKLRSRSLLQTIDFNKKSGIEAVMNEIVGISDKTLKTAWSEVVTECLDGIKATVEELSCKNIALER